MTTEEELEQTKRLLEDAKGRIKAVEFASYEIKRDAKKAQEQAEAIQAETQAALVTAGDQLKISHAIGCGIFGMAELCRAFMARKTSSVRMVHREMKQVEQLQAFVDATAKNDQALLKAIADKAKQTIQAIKADGEANRQKVYEYALALGFKKFEETFDQLVKAE